MAQASLRSIRSARTFVMCVFKNSSFINSPCVHSSQPFSSALFIPGNKAMDTFSYLSPCLDFDKRFSDLNKLQEEMLNRGINVDVSEMKKTWELYKYLKSNKSELDKKRDEYSKRCVVMYKIKEPTPQEKTELIAVKIKIDDVKKDIKVIQETLWELEESIVIRALNLPNKLDPTTPTKSAIISETRGEIPASPENARSHIEIGTSSKLLDYRNPMQYFLCNEAASFELGVLNFAGKIFSEAGAIPFAGLDFGRSLVVEGSGLDYEDPAETFVLKNYQDQDKNPLNHMHVVGGASLVSFLSLHTKRLVNPKNLPLKYFATGRQYAPSTETDGLPGLFSVCQQSVLHAFALLKNEEQYKTQLDELISSAKKLYDGIGEHYRIVVKSAMELRANESLRVSFEMWSAFNGRYVEVGHVSGYGDYPSKRLLIMCQTATGSDYTFVVSGTVLSVPKVLACLLENHPGKFAMPEKVGENLPENRCR